MYDTKSSGASIYKYWFDELRIEIFSNKLEPTWSKYGENKLTKSLISKISEEQIYDILNSETHEWCIIDIESIVPCQNEIIKSFYSAIKLLKKHTRSTDVEDWNWGQLHFIEYSHLSLGELNLLGTFFKTKISAGGSSNTINVANSIKNRSGGYIQTLGVSFRQVFDMGYVNMNTKSLFPGQSGHFSSPHYEDMMNETILDNVHAQRADRTSSQLNEQNINTSSLCMNII